MRSIVTVTNRRAFDRLGGLSLWQRSVRALRHAGSEKVQLVAASGMFDSRSRKSAARELRRDRDSLIELDGPSLSASELAAVGADYPGPTLVVPGDSVFDQRILSRCLQSTGPVACIDRDPPPAWDSLLESSPRVDGARFCGPFVVTVDWLEHNPGDPSESAMVGIANGSLPVVDVDSLPVRAPNLRRDLRPYWFPAPRAQARRSARDLLLSSTQKGSLDLPAIVHAPIERLLTWMLADTRITPNLVTVLTTLAAWVATFMFIDGRLVAGLLLALAVGILDGVDGKLARLRIEFSRLGELEHWLDFLYEWSWWAALAYYFSTSGLLPDAWRYFALLALFEVVDGLAKLVSIRYFGRLIDEMSPIERLVRVFGGRRNVYVWVMALGALMGRPEVAYQILPIWQGATTLVHWIRLPFLLASTSSERTATRIPE